MGSDRRGRPERRLDRVSIHAPAWGATSSRHHRGRRSGVSIHAPAWGATAWVLLWRILAHVSIHAPAWGATRSMSCLSATARFQFTLPHGERLRKGPLHHLPRARFNSRSRMGSDALARGLDGIMAVSIHAPAWGATGVGDDPRPIPPSFNSRSRMGSDLIPRDVRSGFKVSIHAPAWGATSSHARVVWEAMVSIHAPAWGATSARRTSTASSPVSIHAPAWGATRHARGRPSRARRFNSRSRMGSD